MSSVPEELIVELLSKLPAKSLFRFRCVSKQWLHLLSSSQGPRSVKNLHNKNHNRTPFLLAWNEARFDQWLGREDVRPDVPEHLRRGGYNYFCMYVIDMLTNKLHHKFTLDIPLQYQTIVSCHGLVFFTKYYSYRGGKIYVCNPSTGETMVLPNSSTNCHSVCRTGFGYLPSVNQYKVVSWFYDNDNDKNEGFEIITLKDGGKVDSYYLRSVESSWSYSDLRSPHLCVNGVIYWLIDAINDQRLLALDLESEEHEIVSVPSPDFGYWELMELKGSLCLAEYAGYISGINKIWMLNDKKYLEWTPIYDIREWFEYLIDSSFITNNCKEVVVFDVKIWSDVFLSYINEIKGIPLEFGFPELKPRVYFDSLFSLNGSETYNESR